jgi:hypothetical protein
VSADPRSRQRRTLHPDQRALPWKNWVRRTPRRGGTARLAFAGADATESLDPFAAYSPADLGRQFAAELPKLPGHPGDPGDRRADPAGDDSPSGRRPGRAARWGVDDVVKNGSTSFEPGKMVGAGAYRVVAFAPGRETRLERYDGY